MAGSAGSFITPAEWVMAGPAIAAALLGSECAAGRAANLPASVIDTQDSIIPCQSKIKWLRARWGPGSGRREGDPGGGRGCATHLALEGQRGGAGRWVPGPGRVLSSGGRQPGAVWAPQSGSPTSGPGAGPHPPGAMGPFHRPRTLGLGCGGLMEAPLGLGAWTPGQCDRVGGAHGSCRGAPAPHPRSDHHAARRLLPPPGPVPALTAPMGLPLAAESRGQKCTQMEPAPLSWRAGRGPWGEPEASSSPGAQGGHLPLPGLESRAPPIPAAGGSLQALGGEQGEPAWALRGASRAFLKGLLWPFHFLMPP